MDIINPFVHSLISRVFTDRSSFSIHAFLSHMVKEFAGFGVLFETSPPAGKSKLPLFVVNFFVAFIAFLLWQLIKCLCTPEMCFASCIQFS